MHTANHALWGMTIGRIVGRPIQGAILASTPDLLTIPLFGYFQYLDKRPPEKAPREVLDWYATLHNWPFAALLTAAAFALNHSFGILMLAWDLHVFEDAFVHTKMAMPFLFPFWKGKIAIYSAQEHKWIQVLDLALMIIANIIFTRFGIGW